MPTLPGNDWENPHIVGRNKEPAHVTLIPYPDTATALASERNASPYFKLLNGDWHFNFAPNPSAAPPDFYHPGYDASAWDKIAVPGNWQVQGSMASPATWDTWRSAMRAIASAPASPLGKTSRVCRQRIKGNH